MPVFLRQSSIEEAFSGTVNVSHGQPSVSQTNCEIKLMDIAEDSYETTQEPSKDATGDESSSSVLTAPNESSPMQPKSEGTVADSQETSWKGEPLQALRTEVALLPPLRWSAVHKIYFKCNGEQPIIHQPYPESYVDTWSESHVRMPCSPESLYPIVENGNKTLIPRWAFIERILREKVTTSADLQKAILSYNARFVGTWSFNVLHSLISEDLIPDGGTSNFFQKTLPATCALALNLPIYLTRSIPLLKSGNELSLTLSQLQIASLVANAFFCTYPRRNSRKWDAEFASYPFINCAYLFTEVPRRGASRIAPSQLARKREKLRCLLHYFHRVTEEPPTGCVTFTRRRLGSRIPDWENSQHSFDQFRIHVDASGKIEDSGSNTIHVDFANRYLGGGVLNRGCVQEEIMFLLQPELIASCLFFECLADDETAIIEGAEQYSTHSGYGNTFCWTGDFRESATNNGRDEWGRWKKTVVAMDATPFALRDDQFEPALMLRELNKAYCGFSDDLAPNRKMPSLVATGNWGCGAFRGNVHLKALLQMMACCQAGKSMAYYTFGDTELRDQLFDIHSFLSSAKVTVGQLWRTMLKYSEAKRTQSEQFYDFLKRNLKTSG